MAWRTYIVKCARYAIPSPTMPQYNTAINENNMQHHLGIVQIWLFLLIVSLLYVRGVVGAGAMKDVYNSKRNSTYTDKKCEHKRFYIIWWTCRKLRLFHCTKYSRFIFTKLLRLYMCCFAFKCVQNKCENDDHSNIINISIFKLFSRFCTNCIQCCVRIHVRVWRKKWR